MDKNPVLVAKNLSTGYALSRSKKEKVSAKLCFELYKGEMAALLGRNGAGKSTLIKTLCGFIEPLGGSIELFGRRLEDIPSGELSRLVGVVLTEKEPIGGITVRELAMLGRYPHTGFFANLGEKDYEIVEKALQDAGIAEKADCHISQISDGERQKAFVAKALAQECPLIILDEPTAFLDVASRRELMALLSGLAHREGKTILISSHDLELALRFSDRLILQQKGAPLMCGTPSEMESSGTIEKFFA